MCLLKNMLNRIGGFANKDTSLGYSVAYLNVLLRLDFKRVLGSCG